MGAILTCGSDELVAMGHLPRKTGMGGRLEDENRKGEKQKRSRYLPQPVCPESSD
ncbi:hypothetical protein [uncultured Paracoccus sp.]|uniref:hypothetical protein n=1 Tax=uncultured Paracoccus sp. TaxID=189685 RepID=UPI0026253A4D|nr:hypothetical protein [uncultured Paracoccus sp.]